MRLKIFECIGYGSYCGGLAIVAADNQKEACEMAQLKETFFNVRYDIKDCNELTNIRQLKRKKEVISIWETGE